MTSTQNDNALRGIVWAAIYMACTAMIVTLALGMFLLWTEPAAAAEWLYTDSGRFMINGYDGVIEMRDNFGNNMTLNANCAKLIESSGVESLLDVNTFSGTDIYFEECMK